MNSIRKRFEAKYRVDLSGCWIWTAYLDECGYGRFSFYGKQTGAHRAAYRLYVGEITKGKEIDHLCRVRNCVNPSHLELVTRSENCSRGAAAGTFGKKNKIKTHCPQGHPYDEENTYFAPNGWRQCNICRGEHMKRNYLSKRRMNDSVCSTQKR